MKAAETERREADKYRAAWAAAPLRPMSHSLRLWEAHAGRIPGSVASGLEIGCGRGLLMAAWNEQGIDGWGVDIADNCLNPEALSWRHKFSCQCLWRMEFDRRFDVGVCADVMEHIPEEMVAPSLERVARVCRVVLFKIANFPCARNGRVLHLTLRGAGWWSQQMQAIGGSVERLPWNSGREEYAFLWRAA